MIGGVEAGRQRRAQSEMPGDGRHDRQHHGRVEIADLAAAAHIGVETALVQVVEPEQVGEEAAIELRRLEHARDVLVAARDRGCRRAWLPDAASRRHAARSGRS